MGIIRRISNIIREDGIVVFAMLFSSLGIGLQASAVYATTNTGASSNQGVATSLSDKWVKITTSGNVSMSIVPVSGDGALAAAKGTVNVQTNSGSGYQLYVAGSLYDTSNSNHWAALYKNGSTVNPSIPSTTATSTATALAVNQWGYAVPSTSGNGYATTSLYESAVAGENITSTTTMNQLTWKGIKGDYQHILTSTNTSDTMSTTGETTDVYYGTRVNSSTDTGTYTNILYYTAFIDGGTAVNMTPTILPITDQGASTTVTFETGHESSSSPVTPSQIVVELFNSADANATVATCDPATIVIVNGHNGTSGQPLQFTCTVTRNLATSDNNGTLYDVIVRVDQDDNGLYMTYEHQDYWHFLTTWDYSLSFNGNGATSGVPANQTGTLSNTVNYTYTLPTTAPVKASYALMYWTDGTTAYNPGNTITLTKDNPTKTLTAKWNEIPVSYTISYADGTQTIATNKPSTQTAIQNRSAGTSYTFTIPNVTPTTSNPNASFLYWTDGTNNYNPGATITLTSTSDSDTSVSTTLTAVWELKLYMQDSDAQAACLNLDTGATMTAYDKRTEASYIIGKLADGNCWMLQNLYLPGAKTLTSSDSDVSTNYTLPASSTTWGSSNSDTTGWFYAGTHKDATVDSNYNATDDKKNTGSYFSYVVATAGYAPSNSSGTAPNSVCPKGWKLPTSGSGGQFQALYIAYSSNYGNMKSAFKAAYTSRCSSSGCPDSFNNAYWWSSTISSANYGYSMYMASSSFVPQNGRNKYFGYSVRCVLSPAMQDANIGTVCLALNTGKTMTAYDKRDGKSYVIGKLKDGNCWMLQNLALDGGTTITSSDSDLSSGTYTLPASSTSGFSSDTTAYVYLKGHTNSPSLTNDAYDTAAAPGAYYSFIAATAGKGTGSSGEVTDSICPAGWNLPTKTQFGIIYTDSDKGYGCSSGNYAMCSDFQKAFAALPYDSQGCYYSSTFSTGYSGWWSGTIRTSANGYYFDYHSGYTGPQNNRNKRYGYLVRCLIQPAA